MAARSPDPHPRGTIVRDRDGDLWRKGTAWWLWTGRRADTGPGKLLWQHLDERYGPLVVQTPASLADRAQKDNARKR